MNWTGVRWSGQECEEVGKSGREWARVRGSGREEFCMSWELAGVRGSGQEREGADRSLIE